MKENQKAISNVLLRQARDALGWSQQKVAEHIGTTAFTVCRWERGNSFPQPHFRQLLCELFKKDIAELGLIPEHELPATKFLSENENGSALPLPQVKAMPQSESSVLIGRETLVTELKRLLLTQPHLIALTGLPGVGKTTLARSIANDIEIHHYFSEDIFWASVGPHPQILALLQNWGRALGWSAADLAQFHDAVSLGNALQAVIGKRRMLFIIDDIWHIEDALALKIGGSDCTYLVITRLPIIAHQLAYAHAVIVPELSDDDGFLLLQQLAPESTALYPDALHTLVHQVGGLPLALSLIGHHLRVQELSSQPRRVQAFLAQLQEMQARLRLAEPTAPTETPLYLEPGTSLSLQAVIAVSVQRVSIEARSLLTALSSFPPKPNSFSEEAAHAIWKQELDDFIPNLDELCDSGLVESVGPERYTLHQTIVDYIRLNDLDISIKRRFVQYFKQLIEQHRDHDMILDQEITQETTNIVAATEYAEAIGTDADVVEFVLAFTPFLKKRGMYEKAAYLLTRAYAEAQRCDDEENVQKCRLSLGMIANVFGNYAEAQNILQEGLLSPALSVATKCQFLHAYGQTLLSQGQTEEALLRYQEAKDLAQMIGNEAFLCEILAALGEAYLHLGQMDEAEAIFQTGRVTSQRIGDWETLSTHLRGLGIVMGNKADYDNATRYFSEGLEAAKFIGYQMMVGSHLTNLGLVATNQGKREEAKAYLLEALAVTRRIGHRSSMCNVLANLAHAVIWLDGYVEARTYIDEGLAIAREIGNTHSLCALLFHSGSLAVKQRQLELAMRDLDEGLNLARQMKQSWYVIDFLMEWGEVYLVQEQKERAAESFAEALRMAKDIGHTKSMAFALFGAARATALDGKYGDALAWGKESLLLFEEMQQHAAVEVRQWLHTLEVTNGT